VAKFVALARLRYVPDAERQQEWSLNEKSSEPRSNHPVQTGFLPNLRRAPDHQARPPQELFRRLQIYSCKDCGDISFLSWTERRQISSRVIARTLCLYNLGHTQEEAARRIATEHRITVPRRTISHWISGYRPITTFHRLRNVSVRAFGGRMLKERTLEHQQTYEYKVHLSKLALTAGAVPPDVAAKVKNYLLSVFWRLSR